MYLILKGILYSSMTIGLLVMWDGCETRERHIIRHRKCTSILAHHGLPSKNSYYIAICSLIRPKLSHSTKDIWILLQSALIKATAGSLCWVCCHSCHSNSPLLCCIVFLYSASHSGINNAVPSQQETHSCSLL